jgi:hypothetical protein
MEFDRFVNMGTLQTNGYWLRRIFLEKFDSEKKVNNKLVFGWNLNCQCSKNANEFWKDLPKKFIEEQKIQAYWLSYLCFALVETWYVNLLFVLFMFGLDKRPSSTILCSGPREIYPARHIYLLVAAKRVPIGSSRKHSDQDSLSMRG